MKARGSGVRPLGIAFVGFLALAAPFAPVRAAPPDSQTQTWKIINPACTVKQSWTQTPSAEAATTITASIRVACADPRTKFTGSFVFGNNARGIGLRNYGAGPFGNDPGPGPFEATLTDRMPGRHLYRSTLQFSIWDVPPGHLTYVAPPQCMNDGQLDCTFEQTFFGLTPRPLSTRPAKPTPASFHRTGTVGGQPCTWDVVVKKKVTGVLAFTGRQSCIGDGTIALLADREGNAELARASYVAGECDPSEETLYRDTRSDVLQCESACGEPHCVPPPGPYGATGKFPIALPGETFTIAYYISSPPATSWSPPGDCITYDGPVPACTFYFNVRIVG